MDQNELPLDTRHLGVPSGVPKMISMIMVHLAQIVHLSSAGLTLSLNGPKELPLDPRDLGVPSGVLKMISMRWYIQRKLCT
jgi:hypothetical protein